MRILQLGGTYVGAQKIIEGSIHRYLKACGHESRVLYAIGSSDDPDVVAYETPVGNLVRRGLTKLFGKNYRFAFLSTKRLTRQIEAFAPDIVHLHTVHHGYMDFGRLMEYLARKQIPVVYTMHDMWPFTGGCYYYTDPACDGYQKGCANCPRISGLDCSAKDTKKYFDIKQKLFKELKSLCFVAVSQWVYDEAKDSALKDYPKYTVWNAVEAPILRQKLPETDKFRIIGVAAQWTERKGIARFLELAQRLGEEFEILLVGNAAAEIREKAPANLCFLGPVEDREELAKLYASSHIHVSMSLEETFGMTFVEAAFCGVKSIGFDSTAITQVVKKAKGYVVRPGAIADVETLLRKLKRDTALCCLTPQEQDEIIKDFSVQTMAEEYLKIYEKQL